MINFLNIEKGKIRYKTEGKGIPIVLLHGYLELLEVWEEFAGELAKKFQVVMIDLPGHGQSEYNAEVASMDAMAEAVDTVLTHLSIEKCFLVGHSMGGYATLAFAEKFPERLTGFCLFHSSPFADAKEKKEARLREIDLVKQGKKDLIIKTNIPKMYATDNLEKFRQELEKSKNIALNITDEGVISALKGMIERPERTAVLDNDLPKLFILGKKDNYIPFDKMSPVLDNRKNGKLVAFEESGHMGFVEEKEKALRTIEEFVEGL